MGDTDAAGVLAVGIGAVGTRGHDHAEGVRLSHRRAQGPHHRLRAQLQRHVFGRVALRIAEWAHDRERGHEVRAAALHLLQRGVVDPGAVFDAAHARSHGGGGSLARVRMGRHEQPRLRRFRHGRAYLVFGQFGLARIGIREARPLAGADLDDVRTPRDQRPSGFGDAIRPAQFTVDGIAELRIDHEEGQARLGTNVARRDEQVGTGLESAANEVTRPDRLQIRVAEDTRRRDARSQRAKRGVGRLDVAVRIDEAWQQVTPFQVDAPDTSGHGRRMIGDRRDLAAAHADGHPRARSRAGAVDQRDVHQVEIRCGRRW